MDSPLSLPRASRPDADHGEHLHYDCPRCRKPTSGRFYGPCPGCVGELRSSMRGSAEAVTAPEYEPKMNVTPNAVATKD
jgi:hypothetical protein